MTVAVPALRLETLKSDDVHILRISGRLDQTFETAIAEALEKLVDHGQVRVIADLSGLEFLNSRGVSVFIAAVDDLREAGGDLKIAGAPAQAKLVLQRLGIDRLLQQFATVGEAVGAFAVPIQEFLSQGGIDVFVAAEKGKTFHASSCARVKRLKAVQILASKKTARDAGLQPCRSCCG